MTKTFITDKDGATVDASTVTVPSDRHFRNAWTLSGKTITEDLAESKKIFKEKTRRNRKTISNFYDKQCNYYFYPNYFLLHHGYAFRV